MSQEIAANIIQQKVAKLNRIWLSFANTPSAPIARWLLKEDEFSLVNAFMDDTQNDLFIHFDTPFVTLDTYSEALVKELHHQIESIRESVKKEGFGIDWQSKFQKANTNHAKAFLDDIGNLADQLPFEGLLVAVLNPKSNNKNIEKWLQDAIENGLNKKLRIVLMDKIDNPFYKDIAQKKSKKIKDLEPQLDISAMNKQLASLGNPNDKGVQFRIAYLELADAAAKQDTDAVEHLAKVPLKITREQNWVALEVAVFMLKASAYSNSSKQDIAIKKYDAALDIAQKNIETGDKSCLSIISSVYFAKAALFFVQKKYNIALENYLAAAPFCKQNKDFFNLIEAKRMSAICYQSLGKTKEAKGTFIEALDVGEKINQELRGNSMLPYTSKSLLNLIREDGNKEEYKQTEEKIKLLLGNDWEQSS